MCITLEVHTDFETEALVNTGWLMKGFETSGLADFGGVSPPSLLSTRWRIGKGDAAAAGGEKEKRSAAGPRGRLSFL